MNRDYRPPPPNQARGFLILFLLCFVCPLICCGVGAYVLTYSPLGPGVGPRRPVPVAPVEPQENVPAENPQNR